MILLVQQTKECSLKNQIVFLVLHVNTFFKQCACIYYNTNKCRTPKHTAFLHFTRLRNKQLIYLFIYPATEFNVNACLHVPKSEHHTECLPFNHIFTRHIIVIIGDQDKQTSESRQFHECDASRNDAGYRNDVALK